MDSMAFFEKSLELSARGRVRCAQVALEHANRLALSEKAAADNAAWEADKRAEDANEAWFDERGYRPERPELAYTVR